MNELYMLIVLLMIWIASRGTKSTKREKSPSYIKRGAEIFYSNKCEGEPKRDLVAKNIKSENVGSLYSK